MRRILFLDDDSARYKKFMAMNIGASVSWCPTARGAIWSLANEPTFDIASLDHDLDWQATAGLQPLTDTGVLVAEYIVTMARERRPKIVIVHSFNDVGANRMVDLLLKAGINAKRDTYLKDYVR